MKVANANEIARLIDLEELETGSGLNQIGTLQIGVHILDQFPAY